MRENRHDQFPLQPTGIDHPHAKELEAISLILDSRPIIADLALQDLVPEGVDASRGAPGLTGDQVVRGAIIKQMNQFSYDELAFHLLDSVTYRRFCRLGIADSSPAASTWQQNIKRLTPATWETINRELVGYARDEGIERGDKLRTDCTVTETNIHQPDDAAQLWDTVRVLTRLMGQAQEAGFDVQFSRRTRRATRRRMGVLNAKKKGARRRAYRDLIRVTEEVLGFATAAIDALPLNDPIACAFAAELGHFVALGRRVVDQTWRRVFQGEKVPAKDKVVSIFEPHTDIIIKDRRDVLYGHKLCLTAGASSLVIDLVIEDGNPADSTLVERTVDRVIDIYGKAPRQIALDGGFTSKANLQAAKERGVKDVCFTKGRGLAVTDMVKSSWVYKRLRRFRAGVEGVISFLKRGFGLGRCTWRGEQGFRSYAWASVVACNLLILARNLLE